MKILIVNRFFGGAQIPTGRMAEDVARLLVEKGHEVAALASSGVYAGAVAQASDQETKRQPEVGGLRSETGDRLHGNQLIKDEKTAAQRSEIGGQKSEKGNGTLRVETVRIPKWMPRVLAWVWFTWQVRKRIPQMEWDLCVLMTDPPLLPLLVARVKAADGLRDYGTTGSRDATRRVAVWLMDLYPEALAASARIADENPLYKWYFGKRQQSLAAGDLLICLGEAQRALVERYEGEKGGRWEGSNREQGAGDGEQVAGKTERPNYRPTGTPTPPLTQRVRTVVVPPWDDRGNIALATDALLKNLALYAGNLGEAHAFVDLLRAVTFLPNEWKLRFAVRGAKSAALRTAVQQSGASDRVIVSGYVSTDETAALLASARVHLITMSPGWEGIVVPSKLYGCIRTGRPVLFIGPENADTAREIRAHDWGKVLPPGASGEEVAGAILELAARPTRAVRPENGAKKVAGELIQLAEGDR